MSARAAEQVSRDASVMTETVAAVANPLLEPVEGYGIVSPTVAERSGSLALTRDASAHSVQESPSRDDAVLPRFWAKVDLDGPDGCWLWQASLTHDGYGRFWFEGRVVRAHRFAYTQLVGDVDAELVLDHGCRTRHCVNPAHLEPITAEENTRRGIHANSLKTECPSGHSYDELNTRVTTDGRRHCRRCERELRQLRHLERSDLAA